MYDKKTIRSQIAFAQTFKTLAEAYQEIAVFKMKKIRSSVVATRDYLRKLSFVFYEAKQYHQREQELKRKVKRKQKQEEPTVKTKTCSVLISANIKLYGSLVKDVFRLFSQAISGCETDIIIIGRLGLRLFQELGDPRPYLFFDVPDVNITLEHLKPVIYHLVKYKKIYVYYGRFKSIAIQLATVSNVSGDQPFAEDERKQASRDEVAEGYLFEPSVEQVLEFFAEMITTGLFKQATYEAELARLGSRIMSMETARENITRTLRELLLRERKIVKLEEDRKQLERLSGISLWGL